MNKLIQGDCLEVIEELYKISKDGTAQNAQHGWSLPCNKNRINKLKRNKYGRFTK